MVIKKGSVSKVSKNNTLLIPENLQKNINNLQNVSDFIKSLRKRHIKVRSDVHDILDSLKSFLPPNVQAEWGEVAKGKVFKSIMKRIKLSFIITDVDCYEVIDRLAKCVSVIQKLARKAKEKKLLKKQDKRRMKIIIGALNDLMVYINPETQEFESLSNDLTHLQKTNHAITMNIAMLHSLEDKVRSRDESELEKAFAMMSNLSKVNRDRIIEETFSTYFSNDWMEYLSVDVREGVVHSILTKNNATEVVRPTIAVDLVVRYNQAKKEEFLLSLSPYLSMADVKILFPEGRVK